MKHVTKREWQIQDFYPQHISAELCAFYPCAFDTLFVSHFPIPEKDHTFFRQ